MPQRSANLEPAYVLRPYSYIHNCAFCPPLALALSPFVDLLPHFDVLSRLPLLRIKTGSPQRALIQMMSGRNGLDAWLCTVAQRWRTIPRSGAVVACAVCVCAHKYWRWFRWRCDNVAYKCKVLADITRLLSVSFTRLLFRHPFKSVPANCDVCMKTYFGGGEAQLRLALCKWLKEWRTLLFHS